MSFKKILLFLWTLGSATTILPSVKHAPFDNTSGDWARKTLTRLTLDEKIGQLFIPAKIIAPGDDLANLELNGKKLPNIDKTSIEKLIQKYQIGGILFLWKTVAPEEQVSLTRKYQSLSKIPLFIAQDLEHGLDMRLKNTMRFPHNMALGAVQDNNLIYEMGKEIGRQCQIIGVNMNFAPVVDINSNPKNPVINDRSFGENKEKIAQKAIMFMHGLQDAGVIACAKHFPGHGDTSVDSHADLPKIEHSFERLLDLELYPFKKIIDAGVYSLMTGHLEVPALEPTQNLPATLSHNIVTKLLRDTFGFAGLAVTDALNMDGVLKHHAPGELELKALLAGNDLLLCPTDTPKAIESIKSAIKKGLITKEEIDQKVLKILRAKEWVLKNSPRPAHNTEIMSQLHTPQAYALKKQLYEATITLVQNKNNLVPLTRNKLSLCKSACIQISKQNTHNDNSGAEKTFISKIQKYINTKEYFLSTNSGPKEVKKLLETIKQDNTIILATYDIINGEKNCGISNSVLNFIDQLVLQNKKVIVVIFGTPYSAKLFENVNVVIVAYEDDACTQVAAAKIIAGKLKPIGKLPVTASKKFHEEVGLSF